MSRIKLRGIGNIEWGGAIESMQSSTEMRQPSQTGRSINTKRPPRERDQKCTGGLGDHGYGNVVRGKVDVPVDRHERTQHLATFKVLNAHQLTRTRRRDERSKEEEEDGRHTHVR